MASVFSEPYPCPSSARQRWLISIVVGSGVFAFLFIFRPFGLDQEGAILYLSGAYGFITFLVTLFDQFLFPATFPAWFDEKNWTVGKHIIFTFFIFFTVGVVNFFYSNFMGFIPFNISGFLYLQLVTLLVGALPVSLLIMASYAWFLRRNLHSAGVIRKAIWPVTARSRDPLQSPDPLPSGAGEAPIQLPSENKGEDFLLPLKDLLYITAADNYVEVVFRQHGSTQKKLLRNTLSTMETLTEQYPELCRCHRAYLVNLAQVRDVTGNSQGCKLILESANEQIPVSRSQYKQLRQRLERYGSIHP